MNNEPFVSLDWFIEGLNSALKNNHIVIIVDTLRFSSAVVTAVAHGFTIYPISDQKQGAKFAASISAEISGKPGEARYSLSPLSYLNTSHAHNKRVVLYSPNGAACAELVKENNTAYIGCLLNAKSVGEQVSKAANNRMQNVTVIAAGEQQAIDTGEKIVYVKKRSRRVFAVEDYLGCGAIISSMTLSKSPEAEVCESAFKGSHEKIEELLLASWSGEYLVQHHLVDDVKHAAQLNRYDVVPVICDGKIEERGR